MATELKKGDWVVCVDTIHGSGLLNKPPCVYQVEEFVYDCFAPGDHGVKLVGLRNPGAASDHYRSGRFSRLEDYNHEQHQRPQG